VTKRLFARTSPGNKYILVFQKKVALIQRGNQFYNAIFYGMVATRIMSALAKENLSPFSSLLDPSQF